MWRAVGSRWPTPGFGCTSTSTPCRRHAGDVRGRLQPHGAAVRQRPAAARVRPDDEPLPLNWNRSQYAVMPAADAAGRRQRDRDPAARLRLGAGLARAGAAWAPRSELRPVWQRRVFWQNDLVRLLGACTAAIGLFMLGVWLGRRTRRDVFLVRLRVAAVDGVQPRLLRLMPPLPRWLWERFIESAPVLRGVLMFMFALRYCGMRWPLVEAVAVGLFPDSAPWRSSASCCPPTRSTCGTWSSLVASAYFFLLQVRRGLRRSLARGRDAGHRRHGADRC